MDEQHKKLFNLLNELYDLMVEGKGRNVLSVALKELIDQTTAHFNDEESLMQSCNYPDIESHKKEHDDLIRQSMELHSEFCEGRVDMALQIMLFLKDWLVNHMVEKDRQYASFMRSNK